jgi:hypothetical protein
MKVYPLFAKVGTNLPTSGGRSVGIVRLRAKATESVCVCVCVCVCVFHSFDISP